jgi:hypothetical protein
MYSLVLGCGRHFATSAGVLLSQPLGWEITIEMTQVLSSLESPWFSPVQGEPEPQECGITIFGIPCGTQGEPVTWR